MQNNTEEIIFKKADSFVQSVYSLTSEFPKSESFGLVSNLRRTAVFLPLYLMEEASGNFTQRNNCKILERAYSSLKATEFLLDLSHKKGYINKENFEQIIYSAEEVGQTICQQIQAIKKEIGQ